MSPEAHRIINTGILIVVLVLIIFFRGCGDGGGSSGSHDTISSIVEQRYDSTIYSVGKDQHHYHRETIYQNIPVDVDTQEVIKEFFAKNVVIDSIRDSLIALYVVDTIWKNSLYSRLMNYKILRPAEIVTTTILENRNEFYAGVYVHQSDLTRFGPAITFRSRAGYVFTAGKDLTGPGWVATAGMKIRLRK